MKDKTKKILTRVLAFVLVAIMIFGLVSSAAITAHATGANTETTATEEIVDWLDTQYAHGKTDCLLRFSAVCPEGFPSAIRIVIQNNQTGVKYRLYLDAIKGYEDFMYVPVGDYTVLEVSIPTSLKFSMVMDTTSITATSNGDVSISYTMKDIDKIIKTETGQFDYVDGYDPDDNQGNGGEEDDNQGNNNQGNGNQGNGDNNNGSNNTPGNNEGGSDNQGSDLLLYDTPYDYIKMSKGQSLYYNVTHDGSSKVVMRVWGFAKDNYEGVVKIIKSGILGEAEYQISLDGGKSYFQNVFTAGSGTSISSIGLSFGFVAFNDTDELIEGDTYSFKTLKTFSTKSSVNPDVAMLMTVGNPTHSVGYIVTLMSSGACGVSKISVRLDEENAKETIYTIPEDGVVELADKVQLVFNTKYEYRKGQTFTVSIDLGEEVKQNYTPLIILGGVVVFGAIIGFMFLSSKREKKAHYVIRPYKGYQDDSEYNK